MRKFVAALCTVGACLAGAVVAAPVAQAASVTSHGVKVTVPGSVTAYNGAKAAVKPTAKVNAGVNESVTKLKILVYKGKKRVASGSSVKLRVGAYTQQVQVSYASWTYTTRTTSKQVLTDPDQVAVVGNHAPTRCTVTQVNIPSYYDGLPYTWDDVDYTNGEVVATCASPDYPGQTITTDSWCDELGGSGTPFVGQQVTNNQCYDDYDRNGQNFHAYYVTVPVRTKVKTGLRTHSFTTPKKPLKIVDGGHRRIWSGGYVKDDDGYTTQAFTVPAHWKLSYAYEDLSDDLGLGCVFDASVYQYQSGEWKYFDNVVDAWDEGDSGWVKYLNGAGKSRVWINSSCDYWAVVVTWK